MVDLMNIESLLDLAKEVIDQNSENVHDELVEEYLIHLSDTYYIAGETAETVCDKYPELRTYINSKEVALAGGLHDIGRPLRKNQLFHELRGATYIEKYGFEKGVADSVVDVFRIAQMFRPHFLVAEQFIDPENRHEIYEFESLDFELLIPRTWQEAIVVFAELSNVRGKRVSIQERIDDIQRRYTNDPKYNSNKSLLRAITAGCSRIIATCKRVERLTEGKMNESQVFRYGFI